MRKQDPDNKTHFGYRSVESTEKAGLVRGVFDSVATRYDLMNDLWKKTSKIFHQS